MHCLVCLQTDHLFFDVNQPRTIGMERVVGADLRRIEAKPTPHPLCLILLFIIISIFAPPTYPRIFRPSYVHSS